MQPGWSKVEADLKQVLGGVLDGVLGLAALAVLPRAGDAGVEAGLILLAIGLVLAIRLIVSRRWRFVGIGMVLAVAVFLIAVVYYLFGCRCYSGN